MKLNLKIWLCLLASCMYGMSGCQALPDDPDALDSLDSLEQLETFVTFKALPLPDLFVDVPEYYEIKSSQFYQEYYIYEDASIIITEDTRESQYVSNYDYAVGALKEYHNMTSSLEFRSSDAITTDKQMNVQTLEFDYTIGDREDAARLTCLAGYLTDGNSMYIITCKSNTDTYENHRGEFFSVIQSAVISK